MVIFFLRLIIVMITVRPAGKLRSALGNITVVLPYRISFRTEAAQPGLLDFVPHTPRKQKVLCRTPTRITLHDEDSFGSPHHQPCHHLSCCSRMDQPPTFLCVCMMVLLSWCVGVALAEEMPSDPNLYISLTFSDNMGNPFPNITCPALVSPFMVSLQALGGTACGASIISSVTLAPANSTSCTFVVVPHHGGDEMVPCFAAVVDAPWSSRATTWAAVIATLPKGPGVVVTPSLTHVAIGQFSHADETAVAPATSKALIVVGCIYVALFFLYIVDALTGWMHKPLMRSSFAEVTACFVISCALLLAVIIYYAETEKHSVPLVTTRYTVSSQQCYVQLNDVTPWDISPAVTLSETDAFVNADIAFAGNEATVVYQWPCRTSLFYNPFDVIFGSNGERLPLTFSLSSSTLVVTSNLNATYVPLLVFSTPHMLKATRVYLDRASFFSVTVNLAHGIGYLSSTFTDPTQAVEINASSVFIVSEQTNNPKVAMVRHVSNPPLFCIGPNVVVNFNASACEGTNPDTSGSGGASGGSNESFSGFSGFCTLQARDPYNATIPSQHITVRTVSFYMLPSAPAPISGKVIGGGFEKPPGLSEQVLLAINSSKTWASTAPFDSYVQSIEIITPLLGIQMLNTDDPSILQFFPEVLKWLTAFVLNPPFRTIQAIPDHFTCDDDLTIESLVPPPSTMVTYLDNNVLLFEDERFAGKVLQSAFSNVDESSVPGSLTSFQLPYEARKQFPSLRRNTIVDSTVVAVQRPPVADVLIAISAVLSFLLIAAIGVVFIMFGTNIYNYFTWKSKRDVVSWTLLSMEQDRWVKKRKTQSSKGAAAGISKAPGEGDTNAASKISNESHKRSLFMRILKISDFAEGLSRAVNGLSYRVVFASTSFVQSMWAGDHASLNRFLRCYVEYGNGSDSSPRVTSIEEFSVMYRSFCKIFDFPDGEEYKKPSALRQCIDKIAVASGKAADTQAAQKLFPIQNGYLHNVRLKLLKGSKSVTKLEVDIREVKRMMEHNNLNFSFVGSRALKGDHVYDRLIRHPFLTANAQIFFYGLFVLIPIGFTLFMLFALQMAMVNYQVYSVNFRNADTVAAFLPTPQIQVTMQLVLLYIFYGCVALVLAERLLHSVGELLSASAQHRHELKLLRANDHSDVAVRHPEEEDLHRDSSILVRAMFAALRNTFVRTLLRLLVFVPYVFCILFMIGYFFLVALWWILTCFLAPNVMIPFAASGISLITSVYGVYRSLRGCKQKLSDFINVEIEAAVNRFLEAMRIDFSDDSVVIGNDTAENPAAKAKFIASTSQLPLPVVEFALNPKDEQARMQIIQFFSPSSSPEFQNLLSFGCSTTTDVDNIATGAQPFIDAFLPDASQEGENQDSTEQAATTKGCVAAKRALALALLQSFTLPQSSETYLNNDVIRRSVMNLWKVNVLESIEKKMHEATDKKGLTSKALLQLGALRQLVISVVDFLASGQVAVFCEKIAKLLTPLFDAEAVKETFTPASRADIDNCRVALPIIGKLAWLFSDDISSFEESFDFTLLALQDEKRDAMESIGVSVFQALEDMLKESKPTADIAKQAANKKGTPWAMFTPSALSVNTTVSESLEMRLLEIPSSGDTNDRGTIQVSAASDPTQDSYCQAELLRFDDDAAALYEALHAVGQKDLKWSADGLRQQQRGLNQKGFSIASILSSGGSGGAAKDENGGVSMRAKWSVSLRRGTAWPTIEFESLLPGLTTEEELLLRNFSLAGINPLSFQAISGWRSFTSSALRKREARCLATWMQNVSDDPTTLKYAAEAFFYNIVSDYVKAQTDKSENILRPSLLRNCLEVSCPLLLAWMDNNASKGVEKSLDDFASSLVAHKSFETMMRKMDVALKTHDVCSDWLNGCRMHCTPILVLATPNPAAALMSNVPKTEGKTSGGTNCLGELRKYTGLRVSSGTAQSLVFSGPEVSLSTLEAVLTVAVMQQHAPQEALNTIKRLAFRTILTSQPSTTEGSLTGAPCSPEDLMSMPLCGIHLLQADQQQRELRSSIVAASVLLEEPIIAYAAAQRCGRANSSSVPKTLLQLSCIEDMPVACALVKSVLHTSSTAQAFGGENQRALRSAFRNLPEVFTMVQKRIRISSVGQRVAALVASLDVIGDACLHPDEESRTCKFGTFSSQTFCSAQQLVDAVIHGINGDNAAATSPMINALRVVLAIAAGGGSIDTGSIVSALEHATKLIEDATGVNILDKAFVGALTFFAEQEGGDTFGLLNSGVLPLLVDDWSMMDGTRKKFAYALAHVARAHKYKRRAPTLLETFRDYLDQVVALTSSNKIFSAPSTSVEQWLYYLQRYAADNSIGHLRSACAAAVGAQYSAAGWNVLLHHVELQNSSGKQRASAIASTFSATVATIPREKISMVVDHLKQTPLFAPLADSLEEQLRKQPDQTLDRLGEKLVESVRQYIINTLHISNSDIVNILIYVGVMLAGLVTFVLLGIIAFSNGSTFSSLIGVAFPAVGGSMSQYDTTALLETLTEKAKGVLEDLSEAPAAVAADVEKQKQD